MSALLKEVLALTAKSEAAIWTAVEQKVLSSLAQIARPDLVKITNHFGVSSRGSNALWSQLDQAVVGVFPQLTVNETLQLIEGFGESPQTYELSDALDSRLTASWNQIGSLSLNKLQENDPYIVSNVVRQLEAVAPEEVRYRKEQESAGSSFFNFFGSTPTSKQTSGSNTYVVKSADGSRIRNAQEREAFVREKAQAYLKVNPEDKILEVLNQ